MVSISETISSGRRDCKEGKPKTHDGPKREGKLVKTRRDIATYHMLRNVKIRFV
jgi:hypothetical protein